MDHFVKKLEDEGIILKELHLSSAMREVPEDAQGLIIWGPQQDFLPQELFWVQKFLEKTKTLLVAIDPSEGKGPVNLINFLRDWGIDYQQDLVVDLKSYVNGSRFMIPLVQHYHSTHAITKNFQQQIFFPLSRSVFPLQKNNLETVAKHAEPLQWSYHMLALTNPFPSSWSERTWSEITEDGLHFTAGVDREGPLPLVLAVESRKKQKKTSQQETSQQQTYDQERSYRLLAFGNSTFIQNRYQAYKANEFFLLQSLLWLQEEEFFLDHNISPTVPASWTLSSQHSQLLFFSYVVVLPLCFFILALWMYRQQRMVA
jgi:ABC-type uncharacterized transport system involved in gliding motility auxiliary subunit